MSRLITRCRSVTNAPPALSPSTAPAVSAPLIGEPTPFTEATATTSQVPLREKFGRRHGKVVRSMGKARVRETGASSSRSTTEDVNALKEEMTTLKGQLVAQDEQIRVQNEQLRAENEQMKAQVRTHDDKMNMILQALAMSVLQIQMPSPDLVPPSTSQQFHPTDT